MVAVRQVPRAKRLSSDRQGLALKGFFGIMQRWGVGNGAARRILGSPPERTFFAWKRGAVGRVPEDTLRRIGYVAGIWKALEILFSDPALADGWASARTSSSAARRRCSAWGPAT